MRRAVNRLIIWPLVVLTYQAWGRLWLTDDQCRHIATSLVRLGLWGHAAQQQQRPDQEGG